MTVGTVIVKYLKKNYHIGLQNKKFKCKCYLGTNCPCDAIAKSCEPLNKGGKDEN